jgi:hypothetical protein
MGLIVTGTGLVASGWVGGLVDVRRRLSFVRGAIMAQKVGCLMDRALLRYCGYAHTLVSGLHCDLLRVVHHPLSSPTRCDGCFLGDFAQSNRGSLRINDGRPERSGLSPPGPHHRRKFSRRPRIGWPQCGRPTRLVGLPLDLLRRRKLTPQNLLLRVVTIAGSSTRNLTTLNTQLRRIDLICKLVAPVRATRSVRDCYI